MTATFLGLNTAVRGLEAATLAIDTAGHNIDNADTAGYSRQRVDLSATQSLVVPGESTNGPIQIGTGVQAEDVTRLRDTFLDSQYRSQNQSLGQAQVQQTTLTQITGIINEPSSTGISAALQNFWSAWDQLGSGTNASALSAQTQVQQAGVTLAQTLNQTAGQLTSLQTNLQSNLNSRVGQTNSILKQIANLNGEIQAVQSTNGQPNDLMDKRDVLMDQLSQYANISLDQTAPDYQVSIDGQTVISGKAYAQMSTATNASTGQPELQVSSFDSSTGAFDSTTPVTVSAGGSLQGTLDSIQYTSNYLDDLNGLAGALAGTSSQGQMNVPLPSDWTIVGPTDGSTPTFPFSGQFGDGTTFTKGDPVTAALISQENMKSTTDASGSIVLTVPSMAGASASVDGINGLQKIGMSQSGAGQDFFVSPDGSAITASNITVGVTASQIATAFQTGSGQAAAGDGSLAIATSNVQNIQTQFLIDPQAPNQTGQTMKGTFGDFMTSIVSELGFQGQQANNQVTNEQTLVQQLDKQRQSVSGVSLDEEMSSVIQYQQAYNASAKVVSTINNMLNSLMQNV